MNKYIFVSAFILSFATLFLSIHTAQANWLPKGTPCTLGNAQLVPVWDFEFPKTEGIFTLCLFSWETDYDVDGSGNILSERPYQELASATYMYDKTAPTCGQHHIYADKEWKNPTSYSWGWTNQPYYIAVDCHDKWGLIGTWSEKTETTDVSGCASGSIRSSVRPLVHGNNDKMDVTFSDNASNTGTTACKLDVLYRFDNTAPYLKHLMDDKQKDDLAKKKPTDVQGYYADDSITWKIVVADKMNDPTDRAGVSGIKYIDAEVKKTKDYLGHPDDTDSNCSKKENYGPQMKSSSGGLDKNEVTATLELTCNKDQTDIEVAGTYEIHISFEDHAGNKGKKEVRTIQIVPNPDKLEIDWNRSTQPSTSTPKNTVYANASDHYAYQPKLRDVYNNVVHGKSPTLSLTGGISIYMDSMTNTWENAVIFNTGNLLKVTDNQGRMGTLKIASYTPGIQPEHIAFSIKKWDPWYKNMPDGTLIQKDFNTKDSLTFHSPFTTKMLFGENETDTQTFGEVIFGEIQYLFFPITQHDAGRGSLTKFTIDFLTHLDHADKKEWDMNNITYTWTTDGTAQNKKITLKDKRLSPKTLIQFIAEQMTHVITQTPKITTKPFIEVMTPRGQAKYFVGETTLNPNMPLSLTGGVINRIFIGGYDQSSGKSTYVTSDNVKIGEASWANVRASINKNIAPLLRNRKNGDLINEIRYITGDYSLSGAVNSSETWKTLVVHGGNLTIDGTFNTEKKNIGIIVLKDESGKWGNVYIKPNVAFIGATIYTDGSVESVNHQWKPFNTSNPLRTKMLENQIVFHGGIYSQNTVGGAVLAQDKTDSKGRYILPGGNRTNDLDKAVRYDLSFLRMKSFKKDQDTWTRKYNAGRDEAVVILLNQDTIQSPPPGFHE